MVARSRGVPMRVTLVHNPDAGDHRQPGRKALLAIIRAAGHTVHYYPSHDLRLAATLRRPTDLVVIAGGRHSRQVAKLAHGRSVPLAVLPTGTANNIATTLGLTSLPLDRQPRHWAIAQKVKF